MLNLAALFLALAVVAALAGCTSPAHLHEDFGNSYGVMAESQLLHPEAEVSTEPVVGLDGQAARRAVRVYQKSFDKSEKDSGDAAGGPPTAGTSPLAGAPPSYTSAATGTSPPSTGMK